MKHGMGYDDNMTNGEHNESEVWAKILSILPDAIFSMDEDTGTMIIDSGLAYGGKNGECLYGNVNLEDLK